MTSGPSRLRHYIYHLPSTLTLNMHFRLFALTVILVVSAAANVHADDRPNILLAIADDWSFGHASAYGCGWVDTPNFDRVAKEGILFQHAYTPNAKCAPSRATILTGRYSWQLEDAGNHMCLFPAKFGGYVERLAADGYFAGFTGKGWGPGIANDSDGKRRAITGKAYSKRTATPPAKGISRNDYAANFKDFLSEVARWKTLGLLVRHNRTASRIRIQVGGKAGKATQRY